jgi:NitT/TauT family transport system ATP-binding protein
VSDEPAIAVVLHAPNEVALQRARNNAANLEQASPDAQIEIVVNAGGVAAALSQSHPTDRLLVFCRNTLDNTGQEAGPGATVVPSAVLHLVERQRDGWAYIRS